MKNGCFQLSVATSEGQFIARYSEKGLAELEFPLVGRASPRAVRANDIPAKVSKWHRAAESALHNILAGRDAAELPPLDPAGTAFQQSVWRELRRIPPGQTRSYREIAKRIGKPKAVRAVGGACGANPIPVLVPCHRVLAANKKIGGFSRGLDWKRKLLAREGACHGL
jgi:O-6-methylguanine DNA methyltransferase